VGCGLDSSSTEQGPLAGSHQHGIEYLGSIKNGQFLDKLSDLSACQEGLCSMELVSYSV
jgi:hypothetical protein